LQSGICLVREEREYNKPSKREYRFVFDYSKELVRFERDDKVEGSTTYIGTPADTIVYIPGNGHIDRHAPRTVPIVSRATPFDLRRIGIGGTASFNSPSPFEKIREHLLSQQAEVVKKNPPDGNATELEIQLTSGPSPYKLKDGRTEYNWPRQVFRVDKSRENVVMRYELFVRSSFNKDRPDLGSEVLDQASETKWEKSGNTFVPIECLMVAHPNSKKPSKIKLTFDWKSVNAPVDIAAFTIEALGAPAGTVILNHQSGKPVEQGRIGDKKQPKL
jgi:hypothetical protein